MYILVCLAHPIALCSLTGQWHQAEGTLLPADSGGTHLSGAQTGEPAVGERQEDIRAGAVHRQLACARHGRATKYPHVPELYEESCLGGSTADTLFPLYLISSDPVIWQNHDRNNALDCIMNDNWSKSLGLHCLNS